MIKYNYFTANYMLKNELIVATISQKEFFCPPHSPFTGTNE